VSVAEDGVREEAGVDLSAASKGGRGRIVGWALAFVVAAALLVVGLAEHRSGTEQPAPPLPSATLVGAPVTLASLLGAVGPADASGARDASAAAGSSSSPGASGAAGVSGSPRASRSGSGAAAAGGAAKSASMPTIRGTHAALVLFWASWCEPCQREAPAVERFARSAAGSGRIVGVDYGESGTANARGFVRRYGWSFPSLNDPDAIAGEAYGVTSLPTTFVIGANGRIHAVLRGPQTEATLARALAAAQS
jgi:thiol-disulfide isomerase/thioredoxin